LKKPYLELINKAIQNINNSYSPYSNFKVSSALLGENDKIYTGVNIESSSFSLTLCAERVAASKGISKGVRKFKAIAIYTDKNEFVYPCGACRQFLSEFSNDMDIILIKSPSKYKILKLKSLLPNSFKLN
jgi:cytidine deaminase